jgi:hypothetical protein
MIVTCFDLEMNQPSKTIIQIGWVIGDTSNQKVLEQECITLRVKEDIAPAITDLTGIKNEDCIYSTLNIAQAYDFMARSHLANKSFMNPFTWGCGDFPLLQEQVRTRWSLLNDFIGDRPVTTDWVFGRRWNDVKAMFIGHQMKTVSCFKGGLKKSMQRLDMKFEGKAHNAGVDALNTFRILCKLTEV